MDYIPSHIHP